MVVAGSEDGEGPHVRVYRNIVYISGLRVMKRRDGGGEMERILSLRMCCNGGVDDADSDLSSLPRLPCCEESVRQEGGLSDVWIRSDMDGEVERGERMSGVVWAVVEEMSRSEVYHQVRSYMIKTISFRGRDTRRGSRRMTGIWVLRCSYEGVSGAQCGVISSSVHGWLHRLVSEMVVGKWCNGDKGVDIRGGVRGFPVGVRCRNGFGGDIVEGSERMRDDDRMSSGVDYSLTIRGNLYEWGDPMRVGGTWGDGRDGEVGLLSGGKGGGYVGGGMGVRAYVVGDGGFVVMNCYGVCERVGVWELGGDGEVGWNGMGDVSESVWGEGCVVGRYGVTDLDDSRECEDISHFELRSKMRWDVWRRESMSEGFCECECSGSCDCVFGGRGVSGVGCGDSRCGRSGGWGEIG
ncbi:hypothetical protein Tco_1164051 [Tanacetum coccineum]